MVESTALEMRRTGNRTVGSNPTLSANTPVKATARALRTPFNSRLANQLSRRAAIYKLGSVRQ